jgi:hypothetical protein
MRAIKKRVYSRREDYYEFRLNTIFQGLIRANSPKWGSLLEAVHQRRCMEALGPSVLRYIKIGAQLDKAFFD